MGEMKSRKVMINRLRKLSEDLQQPSFSNVGRAAPGLVAGILREVALDHDPNKTELNSAALQLGASVSMRLALDVMPRMDSDGTFNLTGYGELFVQITVSENQTKLVACMMVEDEYANVVCIIVSKSYCASKRWFLDGYTKTAMIFDPEKIRQFLNEAHEA